MKTLDFYFAYGSNLFQQQMESRCPTFKFISLASKKNSMLCFPVRSKKRENMGVASIKHKPGSIVEGVIYALGGNDLEKLDQFEAKGINYNRKKIFVTLSDNSSMLVWTYIANSDHSEEFRPSKDYLDLIIRGAVQHGLSKNYIEFLKSL